MRKTMLAMMLLLGSSAPALAEDCNRDFGPWDEDGCGPSAYNPPPAERIPIYGWDYPYTYWDGSVQKTAQIHARVVDDFVLMIATMPDGTKVSGISNQCVQDSCPYLASFARWDMEYKLDAILRHDAKQGHGGD